MSYTQKGDPVLGLPFVVYEKVSYSCSYQQNSYGYIAKYDKDHDSDETSRSD